MQQLTDFQLDIQTKLLRATFLNNMAVLKKHMPSLFEFYQNYQPTRVKLTFDHNGDVNLVSNGALIYENGPRDSSREQAELFIKKPKMFCYMLAERKVKPSGVVFQHELTLEELYKKRKVEVDSPNFNLIEHGEQIDSLSLIGIGLGYHVERLFELTNIKYLFIHEPDPDVFYCAMHCVDIGPMLEKCFAIGGALTIKVGGNANQFANEISMMLGAQGSFNVSRLYIYRHYRSDTTDQIFQRIHDIGYRLSGGWGFFEDEIISIGHTLTNMKNKAPLLLDKSLFKNQLSDKPVFIVGNGPSLDNDLDYIKSNKDNIIIISCGTALCSLLNESIKPDFHIEMERTRRVADWLEGIGEPEQLKEINVIALNTVHASVLSLFKQAYLMPKPKDAGTNFLYQHISDKEFTPVLCCNPTVTNTATAAAVYMGFKKIYLVGVDYGYKSVEQHHSKGSLYYKEGFSGFKKKAAKDFSVKGNFCEEVLTTQIFDTSKGILEILLEKNPEVECFNCSDGAFIELTVPMKTADIIPLSEINNKQQQLDSFISHAFSFNAMEGKDFDKLFEALLPKLKKVIYQAIKITSRPITSRRHLAELFSEQYKFIRTFQADRKTEILFRFLSGTTNYFQANIMTNAYLYEDEQKQLEYINFGVDLFHSHLLWLFEHLLENYNKLSDK